MLLLLLSLASSGSAFAQATGALEGTLFSGNGPLWVYIGGEGPLPKVTETVTVEQIQRQFKQNVLVIVQGTTVDFLNRGPDIHNIYATANIAHFNLGEYPAPEARSFTFDQSGELDVQCNVHHEMKLEVLVVPNLWYTAVDRDGHFRIDGVAPGEREVFVWSPKGVRLQSPVTIKAGQTTRYELPLRSGP